jgi:hypothetical protein
MDVHWCGLGIVSSEDDPEELEIVDRLCHFFPCLRNVRFRNTSRRDTVFVQLNECQLFTLKERAKLIKFRKSILHNFHYLESDELSGPSKKGNYPPSVSMQNTESNEEIV